MKPTLTCRYLGTMLTNESSSRPVLLSSDPIVYLTEAPASATPSNFICTLPLKQVSWRLVQNGHFKVKQQLKSHSFRCGIFMSRAGELEIGRRYQMEHPACPWINLIKTAHITLIICLKKQPAVPQNEHK